MNKINEILNDDDFELHRLLCEIRAKNGLPTENDIDRVWAKVSPPDKL